MPARLKRAAKNCQITSIIMPSGFPIYSKTTEIFTNPAVYIRCLKTLSQYIFVLPERQLESKTDCAIIMHGLGCLGQSAPVF